MAITDPFLTDRALLRGLMEDIDCRELDDPTTWVARLLQRPTWHTAAACRGVGNATFIVKQGQQHDAAKALCAGCPVRGECLAFAMADVELVGVWGGLSQQERQEVRADRVAQTATAEAPVPLDQVAVAYLLDGLPGIAARFDVDLATAYRWRTAARTARHLPPAEDTPSEPYASLAAFSERDIDELAPLLETVPVAELARQLGLSTSAVVKARRRLRARVAV